MSRKKNKIIKRTSYRPLEWLCENVFLNFNIFDDYTIIYSRLVFYKNRHSIKKNLLELKGNKLKTLQLDIICIFKNYKNKVYSFIPSNDLFIFEAPKECYKIIVKSKVKTNPKINSSLEGLYESNNMFCTQCEPEGFRKITWFPDRPDNLSKFTVRIESKTALKRLLSNGNFIRKGILTNLERHYIIWNDPFPKPSYLFALVVGNLDVLKDQYITKDKKKISLEIYTEIGKSQNAQFAMKSLKKAIKWDEDNYDLQYDLERFMIVAVDHFNMGAMENKGLNIFNSKFILSDPYKSTDQDFVNIESIIAHEYFHNWTGNRVTCRDWFQLTLKEGLTVFRDQQFTSDVRNPIEKRIKDVLFLKSNQFSEDQGPNRHSIRPEKYLEINNFYTTTVYEKGAEFIRMVSNHVGENNFKKSVNYFLKKYDGKAVTCEDFLCCIENYANINLSSFLNWYSQKGIITLDIKRIFNKPNGVELEFYQTNKFSRTLVPIPIKLSFFNKEGKKIKFNYNGDKKDEHYLIFKNKKMKVFFPEIKNSSIPSLLRNFSAPVNLKTDLSIFQKIHLLKFDDNLFQKWDICQNLHLKQLKSSNLNLFCKTMSELINLKSIDQSILALLLSLPSYKTFQNSHANYDPLDLYICRKKYSNLFYKNLEKDLIKLFEKVLGIFHDKSKGNIRSLLKIIIDSLCSINNKFALEIAEKFTESKIMEIKVIGLEACIKYNHENTIYILKKFNNDFKNDKVVLEKWFQLISSYNNCYFNGIDSVKEVLKDKNFEYKNPNLVRAVLGSFQNNNIELFHANDGSGYKFVTNQIILIDKINPQIASRVVTPLTNISKFNEISKKRINKYLVNILKSNPSNDVLEVVKNAIS